MSQESGKTVNGVRIALHPPGSARQRRTLDERLRVRFPALVRPVGGAFLRLPPSWRLRRLMLARSILRAYAAANRRDFDLILTAYDARLYEYHPSADLMPPDFEPVYHGHSGYLAFWRRWLDVFPDIRWDPEEILDFGNRAFVTTRQSGHGSTSDIAVDERVFQLFTFRAGLVIRQEDFLDRAKALQAVEVSE